MNRVLTLSLDGEFTFRLHITKDGKLARLEIKKFNDKDDKYKDAKTEYLGKVIKMEDLEKVLRESKEFDEIRPMSAEEFTDWLKSEYKKIFGDRYDDNVATESASKLIASNDDNIENAKREAESMIARMHRQNEEREMFDNLATIKTLLCDAPADVKASFNEIVKYFDKWGDIADKLEKDETKKSAVRRIRQWNSGESIKDFPPKASQSLINFVEEGKESKSCYLLTKEKIDEIKSSKSKKLEWRLVQFATKYLKGELVLLHSVDLARSFTNLGKLLEIEKDPSKEFISNIECLVKDIDGMKIAVLPPMMGAGLLMMSKQDAKKLVSLMK